MPRRGGRQGNRSDNRNTSNSNNYGGRFRDDHDDRGRDSTRRVSFKTNRDRHNRGPRVNLGEHSVRSHLHDEDIDMSGLNANRERRGPASNGPLSHRLGNRRGDRQNNRGSPGPRKLFQAPSGFYLVTIPYMDKYEKDFILKTIHSRLAPDSYTPLYFKMEGHRAVFYVDDFPIAEKIYQLNRMITLPNGHKMIISVRPGLPQCVINENLREKMLLALGNRFNADAKAMDLSSFHLDPNLSDIYCSLARPQFMTEIINVIASKIPDLLALNLDNNKLHVAENLKCIQEKLPQITILHLKDNKLNHTSKLESLKKLPLVELVLEGNPLKTRMNDKTRYVREIRKIFPKLQTLDGEGLPPQISFELTEAIPLPPSIASFICEASVEVIVKQFLLQYFQIYDSACRQPLLDAYHEKATMSLSVNFPNDRSIVYNKTNRNLQRYRDNDSRKKSLKVGRLRVVASLSELPKTVHDPTSFKVDLSFFSPLLMVLSVTGIFKELNGEKNPPIRAFHRTFAIVPADNGGFSIRNDMLSIMNATPDEVKSAFQDQTPAPAQPSAAAGPAAAPPAMLPTAPATISSAPSGILDEAAKQQLVQQIMMHTNMNLNFSEKCLIENNWDIQTAMSMFMQLHKENKIPPEAFARM